MSTQPPLAELTSATEGEIAGQVFIVTRDRSNVRLGLVDVHLFAGPVIAEHLEKRRTEGEPTRQALVASVNQDKAALMDTAAGIKLLEQPQTDPDAKIKALAASTAWRIAAKLVYKDETLSPIEVGHRLLTLMWL